MHKRRLPVRQESAGLSREALLGALRAADLPGPPLRYAALSALVGDSLNGNWSYEDTDAAYFSLSAWSRPQEARLQARFLLADLASALTERNSSKRPVLLLLKHPERFLSPHEIAPLFALMEQQQGSLFVAARSLTDFGRAASSLVQNAPLLLLHRSTTSWPFDPYVATNAQLLDNGALQSLEDHECFAVEKGIVTPLRITPAPYDRAVAEQMKRRLATPPPSMQKPDPLLYDLDDLSFLDDEDEVDELVAEVLGNHPPQQTEQRSTTTRTKHSRSRRHTRFSPQPQPLWTDNSDTHHEKPESF
jgi:hypothetical protein